MAEALTRLVVDCSVVVKWHIPTEDHAAAYDKLRLPVYFNCCHRNVYARADMNAACLLSAAPPWPPSMFS